MVAATLPAGWTDPNSLQVSTSHPNHPSVGAFSKENTYVLAWSTIYDAWTGQQVGGVGYAPGSGRRNHQWNLDVDNEIYYTEDGVLYRRQVGSPSSEPVADVNTVNAGLASSYSAEQIHWGGPWEGLIVSKARNNGRSMAFGYVLLGDSARLFALDVTDGEVLPRTLTVPAGLYNDGTYGPYDFISTSLDGGFGIIKPRGQGATQVSIGWWFVKIDSSPGGGITDRQVTTESVSHGTPGYRLVGASLVDCWASLIGSNMNIFDLETGARVLNKPVEGSWGAHIGYVDNTDFFVADDPEGNLAVEAADGRGGHPLGTGWNGGSATNGYAHLSRFIEGQPMRIVGERSDGNCYVRDWIGQHGI